MFVGFRKVVDGKGQRYQRLLHLQPGHRLIEAAQRTLELECESFDVIRFTDNGDYAKWLAFRAAAKETQDG